MRNYILIFLLFPSYFVCSQHKSSFNFNLGLTRSINEFTFEGASSPDLRTTHTFGVSYGLGLNLYHRNNWFSTYTLSAFDQRTGLTAYGENEGGRILAGKTIKYVPHYNLSAHLGKQYILKEDTWFVAAFGGLNLAKVNSGKIVGSNQYNPSLAPTQFKDRVEGEGIVPSLQLGGKFKWQFPGRSALSLVILSNIGLGIHNTLTSETQLDGETYMIKHVNRGSFIGTMLQYEVNFGKPRVSK